MSCLQNQNFPRGNAHFCCFPPFLLFAASHTGTVTSGISNCCFLEEKKWVLLEFRKLCSSAWKCHSHTPDAVALGILWVKLPQFREASLLPWCCWNWAHQCSHWELLPSWCLEHHLPVGLGWPDSKMPSLTKSRMCIPGKVRR